MTQIRPEEPRDHARVFEIQAAAFGQSDEALLVDRLRAVASPQVSLVAEEQDRVLGHVFFSPVEVPVADGSIAVAPAAAGLAPIGVDPARQGRGIGSALIRAGLEASAERGWQAVFLVGNPLYYSRFDFVLAGPLGFTYGDPLFDAVLQVRELRAGCLSGYSGRVLFHPAFAETGTG